MKVRALAPTSFRANKMSVPQAQYFADKLASSKDVNIVCHELTDRDAINSAIAMQRYLDNMGVQSKIIISQNLGKIGIKNPTFRYIQAEDMGEDEPSADTALCVDFSAKERVSPNVLENIEHSNTKLCIDHHTKDNLFIDDYVYLTQPLDNADRLIKKVAPCYIDASARSATSIIYRMFEALGEKVTPEQAYSLLFGLIDDTVKRGIFICDAKKGTVTPTEKLKEEKNTYEVYQALRSRLSDDYVRRIAESIDILPMLTAQEAKFNDSLYDGLQYSPNGKIAYVEIPPNDDEWAKLNAKDARVKTILNRFRQAALNNAFDDPKLNKIELAMAFYRAGNTYRISASSKNGTLDGFFDYVQDTKIPRFKENAGGHPDGGGGKIMTINPKSCHRWVQDIVSCADYYN